MRECATLMCVYSCVGVYAVCVSIYLNFEAAESDTGPN